MIDQIMTAVLIIAYFPMAVWLYYHLIVRHRPEMPKRSHVNNVIIELVTNGENHVTVDSIIDHIKGYNLPLKIFVVTEYYDNHMYYATTIKVPIDYNPPHDAKKKLRALQYAIERFHDAGYGKETYILHLDDDSYVDETYVKAVMHMSAEGGQGSIRLRDYHNVITTALDLVRVSTCELYCMSLNHKNKPLYVHGEGMVVRADIEYEFGFDYGLAGCDDIIMGSQIAKKYRFMDLPGYIYINPPTTFKDYVRQRTRWLSHILSARDVLKSVSKRVITYYYLIYIEGALGMIGLLLWIYNIAFQPAFSIYIVAIGVFNLVAVSLSYMVGGLRTSWFYAMLGGLLFIPLGFIEAVTTIYGLVRRVDPFDYKVITKTPIKQYPRTELIFKTAIAIHSGRKEKSDRPPTGSN